MVQGPVRRDRSGCGRFFRDHSQLARHQLQRVWQDAGSYAVQGTVAYTRLDGRELTVPFVDAAAMRGEQIAEYLIYIDITPLYAP